MFDRPEPVRVANRILIAEDAFGFVDPDVSEALQPAVRRVLDHFDASARIRICEDRLEDWFSIFRVIQASEIWANHGAWIERHTPKFGRGVRERMDWASQVTADQVEPARARRAEIRSWLDQRLGEDDVLCLPTSPRIAPLKSAPLDEVEVRFRHQAMCLSCVSGLGGLPQISLPLAELDGMPIGLSLIARRGGDETLLALAKAILG